jgi:hypothetical protein
MPRISFKKMMVSAASKQARIVGPSTAIGFSVKMFLPAATAALICCALKAGGVAMIT